MDVGVDPDVVDRIERLEIPFNQYGFDRYGVSKKRLALFYSMLSVFYRRYFRVKSHRIHHIPDRGRAMLIGNHSGGLPVDAGMLLASLLLDHEPPRIGHGMVEKFAHRWPFVSHWFDRVGQFTGVPEHAVRLLNDERLLVVYPEGARGTGKLYKDRYTLVRFGTGFMRLALATNSPIVPHAFIGGEEALPVMYHAKTLAKIVRAPYWPVPKHIIPVPLPVQCDLLFGEPMTFDGDGTESDEVIVGYVEQVRARIRTLIAEGLELRGVDAP